MKCECGNDEAILEVPFHTDRVWLCLKCLDKYFPSGGAGDYAKNQGLAEAKEGEGAADAGKGTEPIPWCPTYDRAKEYISKARQLELNRPEAGSLPEMRSTLP